MMTMEEADIGLKIQSTLHLKIVKFIIVVIKLVAMSDVDIGLKRPVTLPIEIV